MKKRTMKNRKANATYPQMKWEDVGTNARTDFRTVFNSAFRELHKLEHKLIQMAEMYKAAASIPNKRQS